MHALPYLHLSGPSLSTSQAEAFFDGGYGLFVSDVCVRSNLAYNYGPRTLTYTACVLY